ncbi:MAG TPA: hypothetical protein VFA28_07250 [Bryobacteraceae bacterium]|nr:hypothetical protein [Bryobacteraceae bacterium]
MRYAAFLIAALVAGKGASAQSNITPSAGLESQWDVQKLLDSIAAGARRLKPLVDRTDPAKWNYADANQSYIAQWKIAQNEIEYLIGATQSLSKQPEKLSLALETWFRLAAMENTISSLADGVQNHSNPALADQIRSALAENAAGREQLRQYLLDLANQKEQEYQIMDREAQRCRAMLTRQPSSADATKSRSRH